MENGIADILINVARKYAHKTAIHDPKGATTYGELEDQVLRTANFFVQKGIKKQDKVLVLVPVSAALYRVTMALNAIGATAIFIEGWVDRSVIERAVTTTHPDAVVSNWKGLLFARLNKVLRTIPLKLNAFKCDSYQKLKSTVIVSEKDIALISFTSGSGGKPKLIRRSFGFLGHQHRVISAVKNNQVDDVELVFFPAFLFLNLLTGSTSVLIKTVKKKSKTSRQIAHAIKMHKVNAICASPAIVKQLAEQCAASELRGIKKVITGGAPVFPNDAKLLVKAFAEAKIKVIYGSSEAEPISIISGHELANSPINEKGIRAGRVHKQTEVKIIPVNNAVGAHNQPSIGEIVVCGPNVLLGENDSSLITINGLKWHKTGDCGVLDDKHYLSLTGRCSALIHFNGSCYSPLVFEGLCGQIPGVTRATILLVNQKMIAVIQAKKSLRAAILKEIHGLGYPIAQTIFLKKIPLDKRHNGKIKYEELKRNIEAQF